MKLKIFIVVFVVIVAAMVGRSLRSGEQSHVAGDAQQDASTVHQGETQGESSARRLDQSFRLTDGARVEVHGINGPVSIEATNSNIAEVHITSAAGSAGALENHKIIVEQTDARLVVRGKGDDNWGFWRWLRGADKARHNVTLKLPRRVELATRGINGKVTIGEMEGSVQVSGVNGSVEIAGTRGVAEVNGVNGGVSLTITHMGDDRVRVNGINGGVELRLGNEVSADLNVSGLNGNVAVEAPNVEVLEQKRSKLRARIGAGGAEIKVNGINGGVRLVGV